MGVERIGADLTPFHFRSLHPSLSHWGFWAFYWFSSSWSCLLRLLIFSCNWGLSLQLLLLRGDLEHNCLFLENTSEHKFLDILCNNAWHSLVKGTWVHNCHLPSSNFGTTMIKNAANLTGALLYISERVSLSFVCLLWEQVPNSRNDVYVMIFLMYWEVDGYLICKPAMGNLEYPGRLLGLRLAWIPQGLGKWGGEFGEVTDP